MHTSRGYHTATLLLSGKVLITGGITENEALASAEIYDPDIGTLTPTGNMNTARLYHTATLLPNGKVLIIGGTIAPLESYDFIQPPNPGESEPDINNIPIASAELYDPNAGQFALTGSMNTGRSYHTATLLPNGKVLITGGMNGSEVLASADLYDPDTGTFMPAGNMNVARVYHTATLLSNSEVLIVGPDSGADLYQ